MSGKISYLDASDAGSDSEEEKVEQIRSSRESSLRPKSGRLFSVSGFEGKMDSESERRELGDDGKLDDRLPQPVNFDKNTPVRNSSFLPLEEPIALEILQRGLSRLFENFFNPGVIAIYAGNDQDSLGRDIRDPNATNAPMFSWCSISRIFNDCE